MKIEGAYTFDAPRELVWETLQDPDALRACIPGVQTFEQTGPGEYQATVRIGVGAVRGTFSSTIRVSDQQRPTHYTLGVDARGTAGVVHGEASCDLAEDGPGRTVLTWSAEASVGGTIAAVGQRLLSGVAKMTVNQLFNAMNDRVRRG